MVPPHRRTPSSRTSTPPFPPTHANGKPARKPVSNVLRETKVPAGLLVNQQAIRLVYAPRGESSGFLTFRIPEMTQVAGRPLFAALDMLLSADRLFNVEKKKQLPAILAASSAASRQRMTNRRANSSKKSSPATPTRSTRDSSPYSAPGLHPLG